MHLWEEIDKIEAVSDVDEDSDLDTGGTAESGSLQSVPRPSIRPFFGHTGSSEETLSLVSSLICSIFLSSLYLQSIRVSNLVPIIGTMVLSFILHLLRVSFLSSH